MITSPADLPPQLLEALAVHECLRRLGFHAEDIYLNAGTCWLQVLLKAQGLEFSINIVSPSTMDVDSHKLLSDKDAFTALWQEAVEAYNRRFTEVELRDLLDRSDIRGQIVRFIEALLCKGFNLPAEPEKKFPPSIHDNMEEINKSLIEDGLMTPDGQSTPEADALLKKLKAHPKGPVGALVEQALGKNLKN